jgi:hypothetical protein
VTETKTIHEGLPTICRSGNISVKLDLTIKNELVFLVNGVETPAIPLPAGSLAIPAACLLKRGQVVTLANALRFQ